MTTRIEAEGYDRTNFIENTPAVREGAASGVCAAGAANLIDLINVTDQNGVCAISYTSTNEYVQYRLTAPAGTYDFTFRNASDTGAASGMKVDLNGATLQTVPGAAMGLGTYASVVIKDVKVADGANVLGITFTGAVNLNYIEISKSAPVAAMISADFEADAVNTIPAGWQTFVGYVPSPAGAATKIFVDGTRAHSGTHSLKVIGPVNGPVQIVKKLPSKPANLYMRAWVYMSRSMGNDSGDNHEHIMGLKKDENGSFSANNELRIGQGKGHLGYNIVPSDAISPVVANWASGPTTPVNTWYCVEAGILTAGAYDQADMWVNGTLVNSVTSAAGWHSPVDANWADSVMGHVFFGWHSFSSHAADIWMDDIIVADKRIGCGN